jgi:hypothetical protein
MAVRAALGASGGRIVRQLLTESVLLAAVSGLIGTVLALAGLRLIRAFAPGNLPRLNEVSLDLRVLGWTLAISHRHRSRDIPDRQSGASSGGRDCLLSAGATRAQGPSGGGAAVRLTASIKRNATS